MPDTGVILPVCEPVEHDTVLAQQPVKHINVGLGQFTNRGDSIPIQLSRGGRSHIEQVAHWQAPCSLPEVFWSDDGSSVRFSHIRTQFGKYFIEGNAYRYCQSQFQPNSVSNVVGNRRSISKEACRSSDVQPAFIQAKGFHLIGVAGVDLFGLGGEGQIALVVGRDAD